VKEADSICTAFLTVFQTYTHMHFTQICKYLGNCTYSPINQECGL